MINCDSSQWNTSGITESINNGFTAIVNLCYVNNNYYLVKNNIPIDKVNIEFLKNESIIVCCVDIQTYYRLYNKNNIHCYSNDFKEFTSTNKNYIITYSNKIPSECFHENNDFVKDLIVIIPDNVIANIPKKVYGIISNYPTQINNRYTFV